VVFEWFGSGTPQVDYLGRGSYLILFLQWLARTGKNRDTFSIPKFIVPLVLILIQQVVSIPTSLLPFQGLEFVLRYLIFTLWFLFLLDNLQHNLDPRKVEKPSVFEELLHRGLSQIAASLRSRPTARRWGLHNADA
jgi:hypothetical protein